MMVAMMEEGIMPDKVAATALVQACIQAGDTKRAESIFSRFFGKDGAVGLRFLRSRFMASIPCLILLVHLTVRSLH